MKRKSIYIIAALMMIALAGIVIGQLILQRILQGNVTINGRMIEIYADYPGTTPITTVDFGAPFYADQVTSDPISRTVYLHDLDLTSAQYSITANTTGLPSGVSFSVVAMKGDGIWNDPHTISNPADPIILGYVPENDIYRWAQCTITLSLNGEPATAGSYTFSINFYAAKI